MIMMSYMITILFVMIGVAFLTIMEHKVLMYIILLLQLFITNK